jgi:hypothetical protein
MASRRAPGPFALSPLQGGRRAVRRRRTRAAAAIALAVVIVGAVIFAVLASLL